MTSPTPTPVPQTWERRLPFIPKIFYGWYILAAGTVANGITGATSTYGLALLFRPLEAEFKWSRAVLSGALSLSRLEGGLLGPLEGLFIDRQGPRRTMLIGIPLIAAGYFVLTNIDTVAAFLRWETIFVFYFAWVRMIAVGLSLGTGSATSTAVANWFIRKRAMVLGIQASGLGFGASIWTPIFGQIIASRGWRQATLTSSWMVLAVGLPAALLIRHRPEQYGYLPDGDTVVQSRDESSERRGAHTVVEQNFGIRQAVKTRAFWILALSNATRLLVTSAVTIHLAPMLEDRGWTTVAASFAVSANALTSNVGRIGMGYVADRFEKRFVYLGALVMLGAGLFILSFTTEVWQFALFLMCYSPAYGGAGTIVNALRGDYFGRRSYASIGGAMGPITTFGTVTGPLLAGYLFDATKNYQATLMLFIGAVCVNAVLMLLIRRPSLNPQ